MFNEAINKQTHDIEPTINPLNRTETAKEFSRQNLFHKPSAVLQRLGIEGLFPGQRVLDVGSGKNELVEYMHNQSADAVGVDFAEPGLTQSPDITAESHNLPFADESFDTIINHYGGLTYPLKEGFESKFPDEVERRMVIRFLEQLSETLRVVKEEGQIHMYPWSVYPFYELTGTLNAASPRIFDKGINFLRVDFRKLFNSAGLPTEIGPLVRGSAIMAPRDTALVISKTQDYDPSAISSKIEKIRASSGPLFLHEQAMKDNHPNLYALTREVSDLEGLLHYFYDQDDYAEVAKKGGYVGGLLEISDNRKAAKEWGFVVDGPDNQENIENYQRYLRTRIGDLMLKELPVKAEFQKEFSQIELL